MKNLFIIAIIVSSCNLHAQQYNFIWNANESGLENTKSKFRTKEAFYPFIKKTISQFHALGYWEASCDSVIKKDTITFVGFFNKGPRYEFGKINLASIPKEIRQESGIREMTDKIAKPIVLEKNIYKILRWCEEHGYPFASIKLDSVTLTNEKINASWNLEKGPVYRIDSILIKGTTKFPESYIINYIRIKPGQLYKESLIRDIDKRLKEIPFLQIIKPTEILFTQKQCIIYIYVKKKNASNFNGVLGLLPDAVTGKVLITGDARVSLKNAINKGESIEANWRRLGNKTQDMRVSLNLPYLFKSPIGTDLYLKLYKRDTSYLELNKHAALTYNFSPGNFIKVLYHQYTSDIITLNGIVNQNNVLRFSDITTNSFGLGFSSEKTDHIYNPRRGLNLSLEGLAGHKSIRANAGINDSLYNNIQTRSENYTGNLQLDYFIPIFKQSTIHIANQTRVLINQVIFQNETMRLGGIRTLRGFDEESINTTAFSVFTVEYRFLFEENSFAYIFCDQAWYENNLKSSFITDTPIGFGAGVSFGMKAGIFTLNYALGKQLGNAILLRGSKVHFGYISYF